MDGKNKDELMMQQQVTHQTSPTMTAIAMYQVDKRQPMRQKKAKENVQPRSIFDHGNNREESTIKGEDRGKKKAPSKSKSQYGDIFHLYETHSDDNPAIETKKPRKSASQLSKLLHSSTVHPPIEEGMATKTIITEGESKDEKRNWSNSLNGSGVISSHLSGAGITFMGFNVTTQSGVQVYKLIITLLPLIPILVLLVQNALYVNNLLTQQSSISYTESQVTGVANLAAFVSKLQNERLALIFANSLSVRKFYTTGGKRLNITDTFHQTDKALDTLKEWRDIEGHKIFASKLRFQIRLDDFRCSYDSKFCDGDQPLIHANANSSSQGLALHEIQGFYNLVTSTLLDQLSKEIQNTNGTKSWRVLISFKNLIRAIENVGIATSYVVQYYSVGSLNTEELIQFLQAQAIASEYLEQASNFSPKIKKEVKRIQETDSYKKVAQSFEDVENEKDLDANDSIQSEGTNNENNNTDEGNNADYQRITTIYTAITKYREELRKLQAFQRKDISELAYDELDQALYSLLSSVALLAFMLFLGPLIFLFNRNIALLGEVFMIAISRKMDQIKKEQQKSDDLLGKLLPANILPSLKNKKKVSQSFSSATVMFSTVKDFRYLAQELTPLQVITLLNTFYKHFDAHIDEHDVYKVETINDQYMVASGIPVPNGKKHVEEIAKLALVFISTTKKIRFAKDLKVHLKICVGCHTGNVVAGVIGSKMPRYCLFGDTVNTAARMESTSEPMKIQVSVDTKLLLNTIDTRYIMQPRGQIFVKGKGMMDTYWLEGIRESIEEKPEEDEKIISEYITSNKPSKTEDSKSS